jgi:hypothetical protein
MPQIDFGRAFTASENKATSASISPDAPRDQFPGGASIGQEWVKVATRGRRVGAQWVNFIFAAVTFLGGLFCAFYFFDGNELLRAAVAWPGEFLYKGAATITLSRDSDYSAERASVSTMTSGGSVDEGGDPFSRTSGLLTLTPGSTVVSSGIGAGLPSTATLPHATSPLRQISFPPPGGDALTRAFNQAVAALGRPSAPDVDLPQLGVRKAENRASDATTGKR